MSIVVEEVQGAPPLEELFDRAGSNAGRFFLDTALPGLTGPAYSLAGLDPFLTFSAVGRRVTITEKGRTQTREGDPISELRELLRRFRRENTTRFPFAGGAVGYFSYEFGLRFEGIAPRHLPDIDVPEVELAFYDGVVVRELASQKTFLVANPVHAASAEDILGRLRRFLRTKGSRPSLTPVAPPAENCPPRPRWSKSEFLTAVGRIKNYIASGDVYQVNLSHRFETPLGLAPFALYLQLRKHTPAPFGSFLETSTLQVASSSPERFLQIRGRRVETRPIKGTRPRGRSPDEDKRQADQLLASEKERAELLMIVDLERNDLGRVCEPGSIAVEELYRVETHPTVHHLVATVTGQLRPGLDIFDCLRAAFPGGSITGAPKIRAMQIIDELERDRRQLYTGSIGYLGFDGNCDLNIAIRTIVCRGGTASYHVGAGIVWDSDPESEYQETLDKGAALAKALASSVAD